MRAILAPIVFIGLVFGIYNLCKEPIQKPIRIGDCFSSPLAYIVKKTSSGYEILSEGRSFAETRFKIVDIRTRGNQAYYVVKFFLDKNLSYNLSLEYFVFDYDHFQDYKKAIYQFTDYESKYCNKL